MIPSIDLKTVRFEESQYLWLLIVPMVLLALWFWQAAQRRGDARQLAHRRLMPVRERFQLFGGLLFWLCLVLACMSTIVALARPLARISLIRTAGIDLVILQDGSTSMRVTDVLGNRWQRSMRFLREIGESISWRDDRLAMALFARISTPQVRLTKDPNTYFFFLDHLSEESPFRLEDDTSWDTNMELGVYWGLKLVDRDEQIHGKSPNAKAFVMVSDGQDWSGEVAKAVALARTRGIPIYTVGVGTSNGGFIPEAPRTPTSGPPQLPVYAILDRASLSAIANAGGGKYFELDRESDREIANQIIEAARSRAGFQGVQEGTEPLYWRFLVLAAILVVVGALFLHERAELAIQVAGAAIVMMIVTSLTR
ncbi:MAG: VWA domain-containing protein [Acidobacteriota bacterium]